MQQYVALCPDLSGNELTTVAERRVQTDNLLRHTTAQYRNRDLEEFKEVLRAQLLELTRREGILATDDLEYREPPPEPATTARPPARP
jgi:hypothetical protein